MSTRSSRHRPRQQRSNRVWALLAALVVVLVSGMAGCSVLGGDGDTGSETPQVAAAHDRVDERGGTLKALSLGPVLSWDPQRISARDDAAFAGRTFLRTLTAYQPSTEPRNQSRLVGDLATDTGTPNKDLTAWSFTLRDGRRRGRTARESRARTSSTASLARSPPPSSPAAPTDALAVLAVPKKPDGGSIYAGPFAKTVPGDPGAAAYDRAVACRGATVTFTLSAPVSDFNEMVSQPAFAPFKKSTDTGKDGIYEAFSNGPYKLAAPWRASTGGSWERNPHWKAASDEVRRAYPDRIDYQEGIETQTVAQQIMADGDNSRDAVSLGSAPPAIQQHIVTVDALKERSVTAGTGLVDYLVPNLTSPIFAKAEARQALAVSTNREAYVTALGGATTGRPTSTAHPEVAARAPRGGPAGRGQPGRRRPGQGAAGQGRTHPARAAARRLPVQPGGRQGHGGPRRRVDRGGLRADAHPAQGRLLRDDRRSPRPPRRYDVFWSNWAPAWASASTILPALFDSSINISAAGPGRDYGYFADAAVNAEIARSSARSPTARSARRPGRRSTSKLQTQGAYIGLAERRALYIAGSDVRNLSANEVIGGVVEIADIAVRQ